MLIEDAAALSPTSPYALSAFALVTAAIGKPDEAIAAADSVDCSPGASYLDRVTAGAARVLALAQKGDVTATQHAQTEAEAFVDATDDVLARRLTRLAGAEALAALGADGADELRRETQAELIAGCTGGGLGDRFRLAALGRGAGEGVVS